jgi:hypothetical protein
MMQKNKELEQEKSRAVTDLKLKSSAALSKVRQEATAKTAQLTERFKEKARTKDEVLEEVHRMAEEVALEYSSLARASKAETTVLKKSADSRLDKLKKTKERESALREELDAVHETYSYKLLKAEEEIAALKCMLVEKSDNIVGLENELADARKQIEVSAFVCQFISFQKHELTYFVLLVVEAVDNPKGWQSEDVGREGYSVGC